MSKRSPRIFRSYQHLFLCALMICLWLGSAPAAMTAQTPTPEQQVQTGVTLYETGRFQEAIAQWQQALNTYSTSGNPNNRAIVSENLARATQRIGQTNQSLQYWTDAVTLYRQIKALPSLGRVLIEQAQAYTRLGQHSNAIAILCDTTPCPADSALTLVQQSSEPAMTVAALGSLGEAYRLRGDYGEATKILEQTLRQARSLNDLKYRSTYLVATLNSLGKVTVNRAQGQYRRAESTKLAGDSPDAFISKAEALDRQAIAYFQESLDLAQRSNNALAQMQTIITLLPVLYRASSSNTSNPSSATLTAPQLVEQAIALIDQIPTSVDKVYTILDLVPVLQPFTPQAQRDCSNLQHSQTLTLLNQAIAVAQTIADTRSESFALGKLGQVYECQENFSQALQLTQAARLKAEQDLRAKDSLYLWEWQTGRIWAKQNKKQEAIVLYDQAIDTLESIRSEMLSANQEQQFDFRDAVDPLYRQSIEMRLPTESTTSSRIRNQSANINQVLRTIDSLRLAELQNYFGNDCVITPVPLSSSLAASDSKSDSNALGKVAFFHSIVLDQRTAIIVRLPGDKEQIKVVDVDSETLRKKITDYRRSLESSFIELEPEPAQQVYQWVIAPFKDALKEAQVDTLVFIQDGIFRSVPMSALIDSDNNHYLVQDYAIATTPSLTLTDLSENQTRRLRALVLGLTQTSTVDGRNFDKLTAVSQEIATVLEELPGSEALRDQEFTSNSLAQELDRNRYPILHIATHGVFGSDAEDTFLVMGDNQKLTINELDSILRQTNDSIDLLVLTACQTASGDDRSALGLAGVAIQAGAKSSIASLWNVNDGATAELATQLYTNLKNTSLSKAKALQEAQKKLIEGGDDFSRPGYWAPFILVGNWQ
jgi:CHAT domain-containing protein